jgi:protein-S-isoprenylcysteine O-methyltransferase Ste14
MPPGVKIARDGALFALVLCAMIFLPAGTLAYWQAWLLLAVYAISSAFITVYFLKNDPSLVARRTKGPFTGQSPEQRIIIAILIVCYFALYIVSAIDYRFGWSSSPAIVAVIGNVIVLSGFTLFVAVMHANSFAGTTITVESDQRVISSGPYAIVRHPMYSGLLLLFVGIPLALGSYWGILLLVPAIALLVERLLNEETFLTKNLEGYANYLARVRWRLVPGLF